MDATGLPSPALGERRALRLAHWQLERNERTIFKFLAFVLRIVQRQSSLESHRLGGQ